jgi:NUDIX domain
MYLFFVRITSLENAADRRRRHGRSMAQVGEAATGPRINWTSFRQGWFWSRALSRGRYHRTVDARSLGNIPIKRIEGLLSDFAKGYATPKIDVRGAVIEDGKVLLVRERSGGLWTLPGGFADVGLSATENVIKEIHEEAGIRTSVTSLYSVRHKAKQIYDPDIRDFYKMFFYAGVLTRSL